MRVSGFDLRFKDLWTHAQALFKLAGAAVGSRQGSAAEFAD
jgi:hypothetical protein